MKRILFVAGISILLFACNSKNGPDTTGKKGNKNEATALYAYKATYSSDVTVPSKPEFSQMVLTVWKMFESNQIDSMRKYYADTVTYDMVNGIRFYGSSKDLLEFARKDIAELDSLRFDISMWQGVHINDKNEDWVYIWARERRYDKHGKADTSLIHEQWKIENNKVTYFNQFEAKPTKRQ